MHRTSSSRANERRKRLRFREKAITQEDAFQNPIILSMLRLYVLADRQLYEHYPPKARQSISASLGMCAAATLLTSTGLKVLSSPLYSVSYTASPSTGQHTREPFLTSAVRAVPFRYVLLLDRNLEVRQAPSRCRWIGHTHKLYCIARQHQVHEIKNEMT